VADVIEEGRRRLGVEEAMAGFDRQISCSIAGTTMVVARGREDWRHVGGGLYGADGG
jgi:hypothetical protein